MSAPDSFVKRKLEVRVTLSRGEFADGRNTKIISDLAMTAEVEKLGPPDFGKASVEIVGMALPDMEQLSTLAFRPMFARRNYLNIFAGDAERGLTQVFSGSITSAAADFNAQPDIKFKLEGQIGFWGRVTAQGQNVVSGTQPAADFIARQARLSEFTFENQGVTATLKNAVFSGSPIEQARQAARQVGAELIMDDDLMILIPAGGARQTDRLLLSRDSGLLGYPTVTQNGVECKCIFNPGLRFAGIFELRSVVPKTSGLWRIVKLTHHLAANCPGQGQWESSITGFYPALSGACGRYV